MNSPRRISRVAWPPSAKVYGHSTGERTWSPTRSCLATTHSGSLRRISCQEVPRAWYPYRYCVIRLTRRPAVLRIGILPHAVPSVQSLEEIPPVRLHARLKIPVGVQSRSPLRNLP